MDKEQLLQIASVLAAAGASKDEIVAAVEAARGNSPQRELNAEERDIFFGAVARAVEMMPAFRDAIALIRPFRDHTSDTLYTDRHSRVGMGALFFLKSTDPHRRATLLLHEAMHVLNNHFTRLVDFPIDPDSDNSAKDLEINSLLSRHPKADLSMLLLPAQDPFRFPEVRSYEQYAQLMKDRGMLNGDESNAPSQMPPPPQGGEAQGDPEQGPGSQKQEADSQGQDPEADTSNDSDGQSPADGKPASGQPSPGGEPKEDKDGSESSKGEGSGEAKSAEAIADEALEDQGDGAPGSSSQSKAQGSCDRSTSEREQIADDLKIEKASSTEQAVARNNTMARVREEAEKSKLRGDKGALLMLQKMELAMEPSKVDWRVIFRNLMSNCRDAISLGRTDHTWRRVNRRLSSGEFVFPGMIRYEPSAIMAIDTSGSMSEKDFAYLLSELEKIVKSALRAKDRFRAFCVDGKATEPKTVRALKDLDLRGGGGTMMEVAVKSIELLPRKDIPDVFILATDGGTSWPAFKRELLKSKHRYRTVVLITRESNYEVAKNTLKGIADVIDISENGEGVVNS